MIVEVICEVFDFVYVVVVNEEGICYFYLNLVCIGEKVFIDLLIFLFGEIYVGI